MMKKQWPVYINAILLFTIFGCSNLKAQQFIENVQMKKTMNGNNLGHASVITNANNSVIFTTRRGLSNYIDTLWMNGGDSTTNYAFTDKEVLPNGNLFSNPYFYFSSGGSYFSNLYRADINSGNTSLIKENAGQFYYPVKVGSNIFYWGVNHRYTIDINKKLYKTNGTEAGTILVKDMNGNENSFISKMVTDNTYAYFLENDSTYCKLWRSDGSNNGTVMVANVYSNANNSFANDPILINGNIFFRVDYAKTTWLWKYNIATGTKLAVKEIEDIDDPWGELVRIKFNWASLGNSLLFPGEIGGIKGLCKSDGTSAGTTILKELSGKMDHFTTVGNKLYFVLSKYKYVDFTEILDSRQLWVTEGTLATTIMLKDYPVFESCDPDPNSLMSYKGKLFFTVRDSSIVGTKRSYRAISNGTPSGTKKIQFNAGGKTLYNPDLDALFHTSNGNLTKGIVCDNATLPKQNYSASLATLNDDSFNKAGTCDSLIALVWANNYNATSDSSRANVWVETTQPIGFVKRHYQITDLKSIQPSLGGRVTLYFTQAEFEAFNTAQNSPKLPVNPGSRVNIENVRIGWYSDTSNNNTGMPLSYTGNVTILNPDDQDIYYNSAIGAWQVSFDSPGFGGFILQTSIRALGVYRFTGNGNWNTASNWENSIIPPALLPAGSQIIIEPEIKGKCILNIPVTIPAGSTLRVIAGKLFEINGNLITSN